MQYADRWLQLAEAQPLKSIRVGELTLRPLNEEDVDPLCDIMLGDPSMNWPRVPWERHNVEYVLGLRLQHYRDYGFGMYAVEEAGKVIGWSGAQVWQEDKGTVELGCFLARSHWGKGTGTKLVQWSAVEIFTHTDIPELYALTRPENDAAVAICTKMQFVESGMTEHYGFDATIWKITPEIAKDWGTVQSR
jgi:RimJ/RimL family protein N-acetyltransferase